MRTSVTLTGLEAMAERMFGSPRFIEFDSVSNIHPRQGNRTRSVDDTAARAAIAAIVDRLVTR